MRNFNLSDDFVEQYKSIPVKWGYGDLGYFIFKRTYARPVYDESGNVIRTEQWWEVVKRVVEGCFSYQKKHCQHLGIPFDYQKAQRSAKKMYDKIFNFKFLPPGRGLWIAGTDFVDKHGAMALNNCFNGHEKFISDKGILEFRDAYVQNWNDEPLRVLVPSGEYVEARIKYYGKQETVALSLKKRLDYKVTHSNGVTSRMFMDKVIRVTLDHRWIVRNNELGTIIESYSVDGQFAHVLTKNLKVGMLIPALIQGDPDWEVVSIDFEDKKSEMVYCLEVPHHHCFYLDEYILTGNCGFVSTERIDLKNTSPFEWAMNSLMLGVGVGADVRGAGKIEIKHPKEANSWTKEPVVFVIPDTREGWVESLRWKLKAYFDGKPMPTFDYSQIRPLGSPIKGFGGVASGHEPLKELLDYIDVILQPLIGQKITTTAIVDIFNVIARCVVAGNVRRSSEIILGNDGDEEFLNLKNPDLFQEELYHHRWGSNNSILASVGKTDYSKYVGGIVKNGEPGFGWVENARNYGRLKDGFKSGIDELVMGMNPCGEIWLSPYGLCNLVSVFPTNHDTAEEFFETLKYAYLYTKSITLVNTESPETNQTVLRERRIGVSIGGIIDAFAKFGRREFLEKWCDVGYEKLLSWDKIYSNWLCVPRSIKMTTVKPDGTLGLLAGVSPGIHYPHSKYYIRRVRISESSELVETLKNAGYHIEKDVYSRDTVVVQFPIEIAYFDRSKTDVTLWEQMQNTSDLQYYWADNAVSVTVTFKDSEINDLARALECYEDKLKSVSFLRLDNDIYKQMPYETIDERTYNEMKSKIKPIDLEISRSKGTGEKFCTNDSCSL
jgi:ribonucleoside-triphosphate reductase (thioredoxin)